MTQDRPAPLPPVETTLSGAQASPLVPAAGLVLLAAALALFAVRGAVRTVLGLLVGAAAGTLAWSGARALGGWLGEASSRVQSAGPGPAEVTLDVSRPWPALTLAAGVIGLAGAVLIVLRGRGWPGMGRRYERSPAAGGATSAPASDEDRAQLAWKALDRGEDPTT